MIHNNYPTYEAGVNITLPIRNRAAQANNAQAAITQRLQQVQYRQTQNTIVLNVRQTIIALVKAAPPSPPLSRPKPSRSKPSTTSRKNMSSAPPPATTSCCAPATSPPPKAHCYATAST